MRSKSLKSMVLLVLLFLFQNVNAQEAPKPVLFDSFVYSNGEDGSARLDNLQIALSSRPTTGAYIIVYGGKVGKKGEIEAHLRGIMLAFERKVMDPMRIFRINGGYRDKVTIELWLIPDGSGLPAPTPTVDRKKVRIRGVAPKSIPYFCC